LDHIFSSLFSRPSSLVRLLSHLTSHLSFSVFLPSSLTSHLSPLTSHLTYSFRRPLPRLEAAVFSSSDRIEFIESFGRPGDRAGQGHCDRADRVAGTLPSCALPSRAPPIRAPSSRAPSSRAPSSRAQPSRAACSRAERAANTAADTAAAAAAVRRRSSSRGRWQRRLRRLFTLVGSCRLL
jgi:hypothetical protein